MNAIQLLTPCAILSLALPLAAGSEPIAPTPATGEIPVLLVTGASNHDWEWTSKSLAAMLQDSGRFAVEITREPAKTLADAKALARFRAIVLDYNGPRWGEPAETSFLAAVRGGVGVVVIHASDNAFEGWTEYERLVGDLWRAGTGHGSFHPFDVTIVDREHPVTRGLGDLRAHPDELYHKLVRTPGVERRVLATALSSKESGGTGEAEPMILVGNYGEGRVFHTPLGHVWRDTEATRASHMDPQFRALIVRGTEWAATGEVRDSGAIAASASTGWKSLFDGTTSKGWRSYKGKDFPAKGWRIQDGALVVEKGGTGGDIVTTDAYGDFAFEFEWKVTANANSGVMVRVTEDAEYSWNSGPEYQVLDDAALGEKKEDLHSAGALYDLVGPQNKTVRPVGEWNSARIVMRGWHVEHWLNGRRIVSCDLASEEGQKRIASSKFAQMPGFAKAARGAIALQDHGDEVSYRNLRIRELPNEVALFDGKTLKGWTAFLQDGGKMEDVWSVDGEGNLICKGNPIGYLRTVEDHQNFVLRLEWRFDPVTKQAGNSGVLVRMIGEDKVWPRSIEAQLQSGNAGDFWNIDDFPMKAAPERTSGRNTKKLRFNEKPVGEWNQYEITVLGGSVVLEVNGDVLNEATDALEVPGKICLQSEGAPIHFRNIRLTSYD